MKIIVLWCFFMLLWLFLPVLNTFYCEFTKKFRQKRAKKECDLSENSHSFWIAFDEYSMYGLEPKRKPLKKRLYYGCDMCLGTPYTFDTKHTSGLCRKNKKQRHRD